MFEITTTSSLILTCIILFGVVFGLLLIAYEDGVPFGMYKRFKCKAGQHTHFTKFGRYKVAKYYCRDCKIPRTHPKLELIEGGANKMTDIKFNF